MPEESIFSDLFNDGDGDIFDIDEGLNLFDQDDMLPGDSVSETSTLVTATNISVVPTADSVSIKINSMIVRSGDQQAITTNGVTKDASDFMNRLMNRFKAYNQN